jgi:dolichol-phosphate mannosyltransferase
VHFSIIIPAYNEGQNIIDLINEIYEIKLDYNFEVIVINDNSTDNTKKNITDLKKKYSNLVLLNNNDNKGQSFSIYNGIKNANSSVIVTLDGDGQNNPNDIVKLFQNYENNIDIYLVGGVRKKRNDSYLKIISSKIANKIRDFFLKDGCPDTGCGIKIFDKNIFLNFTYFDGMHRFLPALFVKKNYKCIYIDVDHRERKYGNSNYGTFKRAISGILNIIKIIYITKRVKKNV